MSQFLQGRELSLVGRLFRLPGFVELAAHAVNGHGEAGQFIPSRKGQGPWISLRLLSVPLPR
jgi:hypothetical protein